MFLGSVLALVIAALVSSKATFGNMQPLWGFHKSDALVALADGSYTSIDHFARHGGIGIASSILATFAIAPWAFVGLVVYGATAYSYSGFKWCPLWQRVLRTSYSMDCAWYNILLKAD